MTARTASAGDCQKATAEGRARVHAPRERCRHRDTVMGTGARSPRRLAQPCTQAAEHSVALLGGPRRPGHHCPPPPAVHPGPGSFLLRRTSSLHLPVGRALRHAVSPRPSVPASLMASPAARPSPARPSHSCLFISKNFTSTRTSRARLAGGAVEGWLASLLRFH